MFKIRIVENKSKEISEAVDYEKANLEKELNQILALHQKEPEKFEDEHISVLQDIWMRLVGADGDKERKEKEDLKKELNNFKEFYKLDSPDNQQQATPDEGPDTFPHPLNPGQKLNKLDYWLTTIAIPKVTGVRVPRIGNLKNHNPFKNPPADTAIEKLVDTLSASLNEGPGDRREDDESDDGKEKRKEKPKSAGSVLQMLQQADPGNKGLHKVYRWLTDTLVSTMREKAYALSKRIQNLNKSGQTDIEYVEPWRSPTVTEELGGNAYIDEKFKSELQFVTDYVASKLAVAINQGKLDYRQLLGVEEPGEDPAGEDPGGAEEPGAEEPGEEQSPGEEKIAVPIMKYSKQEKEKDPKTGNMKRKKPLSHHLAKANLPKHVVNTVMRSIVKQLKHNNIPYTESMKRKAKQILIEELLLETGYKEITTSDGLKDIVNKLEITADSGPTKVSKKDFLKRFPGEWPLKGVSKQNRFLVAVNQDGEPRAYAIDKNSEKEAMAHILSGEKMPEEPTGEQNYKENIEKLEKSKYAELFKTEADKFLNSGKGRIVQPFKKMIAGLLDIVDDPEFGPDMVVSSAGGSGKDLTIAIALENLKKAYQSAGKKETQKEIYNHLKAVPNIGKLELRNSAKKIIDVKIKSNNEPEDKGMPEDEGMPKDWITQGGTKEEWDALPTKEKFVFMKMDPNKQSKFFKMSSEDRMEIYAQLKTTTDKPSKKVASDKETTDAQDRSGDAATKKGLKPETGRIKISTLNQQLKTIDPPANDTERKGALNVVQKHLKPYLKMYNLKLSEAAMFRIAEAFIEYNKPILENKKPTSYKIKIIKANA